MRWPPSLFLRILNLKYLGVHCYRCLGDMIPVRCVSSGEPGFLPVSNNCCIVICLFLARLAEAWRLCALVRMKSFCSLICFHVFVHHHFFEFA